MFKAPEHPSEFRTSLRVTLMRVSDWFPNATPCFVTTRAKMQAESQPMGKRPVTFDAKSKFTVVSCDVVLNIFPRMTESSMQHEQRGSLMFIQLPVQVPDLVIFVYQGSPAKSLASRFSRSVCVNVFFYAEGSHC